MKILACDTSTLLGSVAVSDAGFILAERSAQRAGSHSDTLNGMIRDCLLEAKINLNQIDLFLTGAGPGSFTGIRISLNTIKTLAYVHDKPCHGLDSLFIIAEQAKNQAKSITVMINAFKNMVYIAEYSAENPTVEGVQGKIIQTIKPAQVVRVQDLKDFLNPESLILGDGYLAYENYLLQNVKHHLIRNNQVSDFPIASTICQFFTQNLKNEQIDELKSEKYHWSNLIPIYLRASEAEENLLGIKYISL
jgi:tRNA threonylcarbamoyladenosine biosynthesis protein TsaB